MFRCDSFPQSTPLRFVTAEDRALPARTMVTLGSPVRLQARSRRLAVATNLLRVNPLSTLVPKKSDHLSMVVFLSLVQGLVARASQMWLKTCAEPSLRVMLTSVPAAGYSSSRKRRIDRSYSPNFPYTPLQRPCRPNGVRPCESLPPRSQRYPSSRKRCIDRHCYSRSQ